MKQPKKLTPWDFSDIEKVPCGYDMESVPKLTQGNFLTLIDEHNNLVEVINTLCEKCGILLDD